MARAMLTTVDNPYDPFDQFREWFAFDVEKGYNSSAYVARVVVDASELGGTAEEKAIEEAIDEIVRMNLLGIYKKVTRPSQPLEIEGD